MIKIIIDTRHNIERIRNMVDSEELSCEKFPLTIFREEPGIIDDLISDLDEAIYLNQ